MDKKSLKVFAPTKDALDAAPTVTVSVGDLVPLLVDAWETDRHWLRDFCRDEVSVSEDLYEVLLAYHQIRRCEAA
ncbi:MAG: hypothetical protein R3C05_08910 [Pirellulaceae bacterium]